MHSVTTRRATAFVEATRGISASDSIVRSRATICCVSIIGSLIVLQLLQTRAELGLTRTRAFDNRRRGLAHELLVCQLGLETGELFVRRFDLALRALELLLRHFLFRELHGDVEALDDVAMCPGGRFDADVKLLEE